MAIFPDYDIAYLQSAWTERRAQLKADRLEKCSNALYSLLSKQFKASDVYIRDKVGDAVRKAHTPGDMVVEIWSYKSTYFKDKPRPMLLDSCIDGGDNWVFYTAEGDRAFVDELMRKTDVCARLAHLFGAEHFVVYVQRGDTVYNREYDTTEMKLMLRYYPDGVPAWAYWHLKESYPKVTEDGTIYRGGAQQEEETY